MADALTIDVERMFAPGARVRATLDLRLDAGGVLVLFGPSGAGKSTIVRMLAGLERPDRGVIRFGDEDWCDRGTGVDLTPQRRRATGVFQQAALFPHLTVAANVAFGIRGRRSVDDWLALVGASALRDRYPASLSGGEAQRVALARALASEPRLLLLDEPFAALDAPTRRVLRGECRRAIRDAGVPAVLVTHDRTEALAMGDALAVVLDGDVRQAGPIDAVLRRPVDAPVAHALGVDTVVAASVAGADRGLQVLRLEGGASLRAVEHEPRPVGAAVFACIRAEDVALETSASPVVSTRNHLAGTVTAVEPEGPVERVSIDCGFPLIAVVTRSACEDLALAPGRPVLAAIKATAVHVVPRD